MKNWNKLTAVLLALCLLLALPACGRSGKTVSSGSDLPRETAPASDSDLSTPEPEETPAPEEPAEPTEEPLPVLDTVTPVNVMVLNGTTGFGMAKLMSDAAAGEAALNYNFSVESDAGNVTAALISGSADIAALPTNAASVVYNKTEGAVQALALNTRGVLYLVVNGAKETVESVADLEGKTVYAPAQNPSFIFNYIARENGLDLTADNTYAQPAELRTALAAGEVDIAVLPEPMVTIACAANEDLTVALDLTAEWDAVAPAADSLVQGCVVVRRDFAEERPAEVAAFLEEYGASVAFLTEEPAAAAAMIEETGVFANARVAEKAIPNCNVCFVTGAELKEQLSAFLEILLEVAPQSVGGALPGDDFYYGA